MASFGDGPKSRRDSDQPQGQIDQENALPADSLDQQTAPQGACDQGSALQAAQPSLASAQAKSDFGDHEEGTGQQLLNIIQKGELAAFKGMAPQLQDPTDQQQAQAEASPYRRYPGPAAPARPGSAGAAPHRARSETAGPRYPARS